MTAMPVSEAVEEVPRELDERGPVPVRHYGRWLGSAFVLLLVALVAHSLITNKNLQWPVVRQYLGSSVVLTGLELTLEFTVIAMAVGVVLGIVLAVMRMSPSPLISSVSYVYVWFFRGVPALVQIVFWFNIATLFPKMTIGIPFGPNFFSVSSNSVVTPFAAGWIALGLNEAAYMAEIVRGGILAIGRGQHDAAESLGMSRLLTMRLIVLPQAMRVILPPTGNEFIAMLKNTSLISVIGAQELLGSVESIYTRTFAVVPLLIVASIWYLVWTTVLSFIQYFVERHFASGLERNRVPGPLERLRHLAMHRA